ncbi:MAG: hypothetical protein NC483_05205 [Ruminococcus sp.]|nr:hypothetical protein [Ruminococcus sp.]
MRGLISVVLTITVTFITSKANYRMTASIPLTEGKVVSSPYDINIVAMYIDGVEQSKETTMPGKGYVLTSDSYCYKGTDKTQKDANVVLETDKYGNHIISETSKSEKCILYFKRREATTNAAKYILNHINTVTHREKGTFNQTISGETTGKIYADSDDDGVTYYYAGNPTDNWVLFGGYYWRIIRINGDGSIRMIYQGAQANKTGEGTQIGISPFNNSPGDNAYVGYMYGTSGSDIYEATHENKNDSAVKQTLDTWYSSSGLKKLQDKYIDLNVGFCGDRTPRAEGNLSIGTIGTKMVITSYGARNRIYNPSYRCASNNDLYTYKDSNIFSSTKQGNRALENPIGLITVDEASYAGIDYNNTTTDNYLFTGQNYWTLSPFMMDDRGNASVTAIRSTGDYFPLNMVSANAGVRPVINLRSDVTLTGDGTISNPYKVN